MAYIKKTWMDGDLINASDLNNIENGIENVTNQTKVVEQEFKSLQVGDKMPMVFTKEMLSNPTVITAQYGISRPGTDGIDGYFWFDPDSTLGLGGWEGDVIGALGIYDEETETLTIDLTQADISNNIVRSVNTNFGSGLIGNKIDKQLTAQEVYNDLKQEIANRGGGDKLLFELNRNEVNGYFCADSTVDDLEGKIFLLTIRNEASGNVNIEGSTIFMVEKYAIVKLDGFFEDKESMYSAWFKCVDAGATVFGLDLINGDFGEAPIEGVKLQMTEL